MKRQEKSYLSAFLVESMIFLMFKEKVSNIRQDHVVHTIGFAEFEHESILN